ncbi:MAG: SH3 domain-containing protein [Oscillospiraceae bacterium]|nr:SH3 domain-containing protein [Oscillospiraceae bacterium]
MKKLLAIILSALMLVSVMSVAALALEDPAELRYSVSDGTVTLSWDKTKDDTHTVYWKRSSSDEWKIAGTTAKHKVNITGLKNGVSYDFKVEILGSDSEIVTATPVEPTYLYAISEVSIRSKPSYEGSRWGTYSCGDKVEVIGYTDGWYEINYPYSETSKYVNAAYLSEEIPDGTAEDEPVLDVYTWDYGTFTVTSDADIYSDILNGEVLGTLEAGGTVEATGKVYIDDSSLYAYKISYNGEDAYVDKDALTDPDFNVEPNEIDYEDLADRKYSTYDNIGGIEICVVPDSVTSTSATFKIRNSSNYMVTHGEDFRLQVYSDDGWSDVEFIVDSYDVNDIAYIVYGGGNISGFKANWSYFYGELPAGHYRLVLVYTYQTDDGAVNVYGVCGFDIE